MKLYIWNNVLWDYSAGLAFALANSVEEARALILKKHIEEELYIPDDFPEELLQPPLIIDHAEGFYIHGGG